MLPWRCRELQGAARVDGRSGAQSSGCGAASSAPRSGRGGRRCGSEAGAQRLHCHPDQSLKAKGKNQKANRQRAVVPFTFCLLPSSGAWCNSSTAVSNTVRCPCNSGGPCQSNLTNRCSITPTAPRAAVCGRGSCARSRCARLITAWPAAVWLLPRPFTPTHGRIAQQKERRRAVAKLARSA
jgi:hypothetical protein